MECANTFELVVISTVFVHESVLLDVTGLLEVVIVCPPSFFTAGVVAIFVGHSPDHGTKFAHEHTLLCFIGVLPLLFTGGRLFVCAALVIGCGTQAKWGDIELYGVCSAIIVLSLYAAEAEGLF
jgi:hypothetical protein